MAVVCIACLIGLWVVLVALAGDEPVQARAPQAPAPPVSQPDTVPIDIVRTDFALSWPGYEPAAVQAHLRAVARAWADLLAAVPPDVAQQVRGLAPYNGDGTVQPSGGPVLAPLPPPPLAPSTLAGTDPDADVEALRTHAALERILRLR
jgi:hypothetical protein